MIYHSDYHSDSAAPTLSAAGARAHARKSLGQNFLMHRQIAERIADAAELSSDDTVLEVGPGTGMLTATLLARAKRVIAVEADRELAIRLRDLFTKEMARGQLDLIVGDMREIPISIRADAKDALVLPRGYKVVSNIPYYITGELLRLFLGAPRKPASMTLLVQKEVAERIARSKKESILSVAVKVYGTPKYLFTVPKGAFKPAPKVDSAVLTIGAISSPFPNTGAETRFFDVLKAGFAHKRKLLARNLEALAGEREIEAAFTALSLSKKIRAEDVSPKVWQELARRLSPQLIHSYTINR